MGQKSSGYLHLDSGLGSEIRSWAEFVLMEEEQQKDCGGSPSPETDSKDCQAINNLSGASIYNCFKSQMIRYVKEIH